MRSSVLNMVGIWTILVLSMIHYQGLKVLGAYLYPNFPWVPPHPTPGFEGLGSIPLPKLPLSAPTPHPRVWRSWEHTSTQTSLQCPHPCPTSTGHFPSVGPEQGGYCSVFVIATTYYAGIQRNLYIMKSQGSDKICSLRQDLVILRSFPIILLLPGWKIQSL